VADRAQVDAALARWREWVATEPPYDAPPKLWRPWAEEEHIRWTAYRDAVLDAGPLTPEEMGALAADVRAEDRALGGER
jgi:hypothetical protein